MKLVYGECSSKKVTVRATFDAGSAVEYNGAWTHGIAHLVEHMVFQGTKELSCEELAKTMAGFGAEWNAATWHDKVSFYINIPIDNALPAAKLLSEMLFSSKFDEDLFEKEKSVVLQEERDYRDDVDSNIIHDLDVFLTKGPMEVPVIGTAESIASITLEEAKEFHKKYYRPECLLLTITGPPELDHEELGALFGPAKTRFLKSPKEPYAYTKRKAKHTRDKRIQQARVFVSYKAVPIYSKKALVLNFVNKFFSEDMDSRLFLSIRQQQGLCYGIGAYPQFCDDVGWYIIWTRTAPENMKRVLREIDKEVKRLVADGPTEEEISRARNKYISELYTFTETSFGLNSILAGKSFRSLPSIEESLNRIKNVNARQIRAACTSVFKPENKQVFTYLPEAE